jgi:uncharacterized protein
LRNDENFAKVSYRNAVSDLNSHSGDEMENLKELVEHMAKSLVDKPDNVSVDEIPGQQTTLLALKVDKEDLGKVIGKQGKTAAAMRTIIRAAGTKLNKRYHLDIVE